MDPDLDSDADPDLDSDADPDLDSDADPDPAISSVNFKTSTNFFK